MYLNSCHLKLKPLFTGELTFCRVGSSPTPSYAGLKTLCPLLRLVIVKSMFSVPVFLNRHRHFKHDFFVVVAHELMDVFHFPARLLFAAAAALTLFC